MAAKILQLPTEHKLDEMPKGPIEGADAKKIRQQATDAAQKVESGYLELGRLLHLICYRDDTDPSAQLYAQWGYRTVEDYVEDELRIDQSTAFRYHRTWKMLHDLKLDPVSYERFRRLGISKLRELARVVGPTNFEPWLEKAEAMRYVKLRQYIADSVNKATEEKLARPFSAAKEAQESAEVPVLEEATAEDSGEMNPLDPGSFTAESVVQQTPDLHLVSGGDRAKRETLTVNPVVPHDQTEEVQFLHFGLYPAQFLNVQKALDLAGRIANSKKRGHLLDLICTEFLMLNRYVGPDDAQRATMFQRLEEAMGVKIIAYREGQEATEDASGHVIPAVEEEVVYGGSTLRRIVAR